MAVNDSNTGTDYEKVYESKSTVARHQKYMLGFKELVDKIVRNKSILYISDEDRDKLGDFSNILFVSNHISWHDTPTIIQKIKVLRGTDSAVYSLMTRNALETGYKFIAKILKLDENRKGGGIYFARQRDEWDRRVNGLTPKNRDNIKGLTCLEGVTPKRNKYVNIPDVNHFPPLDVNAVRPGGIGRMAAELFNEQGNDLLYYPQAMQQVHGRKNKKDHFSTQQIDIYWKALQTTPDAGACLIRLVYNSEPVTGQNITLAKKFGTTDIDVYMCVVSDEARGDIVKFRREFKEFYAGGVTEHRRDTN